MARIDSILKVMIQNKASDLHLTSGALPRMRVHGKLDPLPNTKPIPKEGLTGILYEIMQKRHQEIYERDRDVDLAYALPGVARFRVNVFEESRGIGAVFRIIPTTIPTLKELALPEVIGRFAHMEKGLVLVTGPTGSGKSTTLASLINIINEEKTKHVLTIEDPIEFVHQNKKSLITQREVGIHAESFASALRVALREDPDVILVGEMRDLETMALTLTAAEMGTLVYATVHTNSATKTVDRIVDVFPPTDQEHARLLISTTLKGVVSQQLLRTIDGLGRVVATEVMICNHAICNLIREGKTYQLGSSITSGAKEGMRGMDQSLKELVVARKISVEAGYNMSLDKETFKRIIAGL